jgi:uncharacterized protein
MRRVFAHAVYWIALGHRKDQWHAKAVQISQQLGQVALVTTDEMLEEFLTYFSAFGKTFRIQCAPTVRNYLSNPTVHVIPQTRQSFLAGLAIYEARADKCYSLTDCISMAAMRDQGITDVLTHDKHFAQEGFTILL